MRKFTKSIVATALASMFLFSTAFAAETQADPWSAKDKKEKEVTAEYATVPLSKAWNGSWMQVDLAPGEALESVTLSITTTDVVVAADDDGNKQEVLRYFNTDEEASNTKNWHIFSDGASQEYSVTLYPDDFKSAENDPDYGGNGYYTVREDGGETFAMNVQAGQSAGTVKMTYKLAASSDSGSSDSGSSDSGSSDSGSSDSGSSSSGSSDSGSSDTKTTGTDTKTTTTTTDTKKTDTATKTGDATSVAVLATVALLAMGGVVYTSKKKEA